MKIEEPPQRPHLIWVLFSVLGALFGVQTSKAYSRDFSHNSPWAYIVIGLLCGLIFVLSLLYLAKFIVKAAGL